MDERSTAMGANCRRRYAAGVPRYSGRADRRRRAYCRVRRRVPVGRWRDCDRRSFRDAIWEGSIFLCGAGSFIVRQFLADDIYYIGKRLGEKMNLIKSAYNIFLVGLAFSILSTIIILIF